jgi:hypothetical protein
VAVVAVVLLILRQQAMAVLAVQALLLFVTQTLLLPQ